MADLDQLIEKAKAGQLALLVGLDLPATATGLPSGSELSRGMASKFNLPAADSLASVAQSLKTRNQQWKYVGYLKQALHPGGDPGPLHEAVASLPVPCLLTSAYDDRLAGALKVAGRAANLLIEDRDLGRRQLDRPDLIKLCGDLSRPHTPVVAEDEYADLLLDDDRRDLFDRAREWLAEKAVLLVGCDPAESGDFENWLYWEVLERLGAFGAGGCLVWPSPAAGDVARWDGRGVAVIDAEPVAFLQSLAAGLAGAEVALPEDKEEAALKGLIQILRGKPTKSQVDTALDGLSPDRRPQTIQVAFRSWLSDDARLQSILDVDYAPNVTHYHGQPVDTGITLQRLRNWAAKAEEGRRALDLPQGSPVERRGIDFFDAILPLGSEAREKYEYALRDCQLLDAALHIVFELQDERGRLSPIPWELLHDGRVDMGRGFLGLKYPVYRLPVSLAGLDQVTGRIQKALIVAADPTQRLTNLEAEVDWLAETLKEAGLARVDARRPTDEDVSDPEAIKRLIRDGGYHLFHFMGHGLFNDDDPSRSKLVLGRARERGRELTATALAQVARESDLILVFLSACEVGLTAEQAVSQPWKEAGMVDALTRAGVPATVGMRWRVGAQNNQTMVRLFYTELLSGKSAERALMIARQAIENQADWANPILTKRHGVL